MCLWWYSRKLALKMWSSFIHSFIRDLLSSYYVPDTKTIKMNETQPCPDVALERCSYKQSRYISYPLEVAGRQKSIYFIAWGLDSIRRYRDEAGSPV